MKVAVSLKPIKKESKNRGIGIYTKNLLENLKKYYPSDTFTLTSNSEYHQQADLIHAPFFDPFFLTLPIYKSTPTVVTIHDLIPVKFGKQFKKGIKGRIKWYIQKRQLQKTAHVITDSENSKRDIISLLEYPENKISVVPLASPAQNSLLSKEKLKQVRVRYNLPEKYLLYVGDINWNKNVEGLIKEFCHFPDPNLHLVLVGKSFKSPPTEELNNISKLLSHCPKQNLIHIPGYIPSHHLPAVYKCSAIYIQPSWYEGFGLPILEAMKLGVPVISSNQGSLPEVGGDAVVYFDPYVSGSLKSAISKLLENPSLQKTNIQKGKIRDAHFTWKKTATGTHAVYEKIIAGN